MAQIDEAITAVMREVGAIGKTKKNEQQGFMYRGIEDVYNRIQPLMTRHGIYSAPKVVDVVRETGESKRGGTLFYVRMLVEYTFRASDGSNVVVVVPGDAMDNADKGANKAMAAAHKIAICQLFNIPYDVIDPDAFTPDWAANDSGRISPKQFTALKTAWWQTVRSDLEDAGEGERVAAFRAWAQEITGVEDFAVENWREWTAEDLTKCRKALDDSAADALIGSGLTPNGSDKQETPA